MTHYRHLLKKLLTLNKFLYRSLSFGCFVFLITIASYSIHIPITQAAIGDIGHWRDSIGGQIPGTSFSAFEFDQSIRNDGAYTRPDNSTIELDEAGDYLIISTIRGVDSSNGRYNAQTRVALTSGSGTLFTSYYTGYSRDNSENTSWFRATGVIIGASANAQLQIQRRRDTDAPTSGSVAGESDVQVIRINPSNYGIYAIGGTAGSLGGTTPNTVDITAVTSESNTSSIEGNISTDTVTVKGDNKRYLIGWSVSGDTGGSRTQRIGHLEYDGTDDLATQSYCYQRQASDEYCGLGSMDLIETSTTDKAVQVEVFRGPGVAADDGGADSDGSFDVDGNGQMVVLELPDSTEVFRSHDSTGLQDITSAVTLNAMETVDFNDSESFTRASSSAMDVTAPADIFVWTNIWTARNNVSSGSRLTAYGSITVNSIEQSTGEHGNYTRGNQSSTDTFGGSFHPAGIFDIETAGYDIGVNMTPLSGTEGGGTDRTQANTTGFFAINLDTFSVAEPTISISGSADGSDSATVKIAVNGSIQGQTGTISSGSWTISSVAEPTSGDVITVWIDSVSDSAEAIGITKYAGSDITGMVLNALTLSLGSSDNQTLSNANISQYDNSLSSNEDIFYDVDGNDDLAVCSASGSTGCTLSVLSGNTYRPDSGSSGNVTAENLSNSGTLTADGNTIYIAGTLTSSGTFNANTSTVNFNGTGSQTIPALDYYNLIGSGATQTAPTLVSTSGSTWDDVSATETTSSLSWQTGDLIVVIGVTEDNLFTLGTPTATGLSFAAVSGFPTNTTDTCKAYAWVATAGSNGSGTISSTVSGSQMAGIQAYVFRGSDGIGNTTSTTSGTALTISLTRNYANSMVVWTAGDWGATNDITVSADPASGGTQDQAVWISGRATMFAFHWGDQGAAGSTNYGISGFSPGNIFTKIAIEIRGSASATGARTLASSGTIGIAGTFTPGDSSYTVTGSTVNFNGSSAQTVNADFTYNNLQVQPSTNSVTTNFAAGTATIGGDLTIGNGTNTSVVVSANNASTTLTVAGSVSISANTTLQANASNALTIGNDFTNNGTFTHNNGSVVLSTTTTASLNYSGDTTFYDLSSTAAGKIIEFDETQSTIVTHAFTITGTDCTTNRIFLKSVTNGNDWPITVTGATVTVDYADIRDSTATGSPSANDSTADNDGNTGWTISGGTCSGNSNPNSPTSLTQKDSGDAAITESAWTTTNTPKLGFTITDPDTDTVKYEVQVATDSGFSALVLDYTHGSFSASGTTFEFIVGTYGSGSCSGTCPATLSDDATGYWWRVKAIDDQAAESSYVEFGSAGTMDFKVDATAPTGGTVNDGASGDEDWNDGTLTSISSNWSGFDANVSGLSKYEYAIRRESDSYYWSVCSGAGTWQASANWCDNSTSTSYTQSSLNLETGVTYYTSVRATDNASNVGTPVDSDGEQVLPTLSFSISTNAITFSNLNNGNSYTDTKTLTVTTSTNASNGYTVKAYNTADLTSLENPSDTVSDFSGSWNSPASWGGGTYGFGYTSNDTNVQGSNRFSGGTLYAAFSQTASGDVVADHTDAIDGSTGAVSSEQFTITYKVSVSNAQPAATYQTTSIYIVTANY